MNGGLGDLEGPFQRDDSVYVRVCVVCWEKGEEWVFQRKREAKHSPALTFALAVLRATMYM